MKKPQIKPEFRVEVRGEQVHLLAENITHKLSGTVYRRIVHLLDGNHTIDIILNKLEGQVEPGDVHYALKQLEDEGYLSKSVSNNQREALREVHEAPPPDVCPWC